MPLRLGPGARWMATSAGRHGECEARVCAPASPAFARQRGRGDGADGGSLCHAAAIRCSPELDRVGAGRRRLFHPCPLASAYPNGTSERGARRGPVHCRLHSLRLDGTPAAGGGHSGPGFRGASSLLWKCVFDFEVGTILRREFSTEFHSDRIPASHSSASLVLGRAGRFGPPASDLGRRVLANRCVRRSRLAAVVGNRPFRIEPWSLRAARDGGSSLADAASRRNLRVTFGEGKGAGAGFRSHGSWRSRARRLFQLSVFETRRTILGLGNRRGAGQKVLSTTSWIGTRIATLSGVSHRARRFTSHR